ETVAIRRIDVVAQERQIEKRVDMASFANGREVANRDPLRVQHTERRQNLRIGPEIRKEILVLAGQRRRLFQQNVLVLDGTAARRHHVRCSIARNLSLGTATCFGGCATYTPPSAVLFAMVTFAPTNVRGPSVTPFDTDELIPRKQ